MPTNCCCGCGSDVSRSEHFCSVSGERVFAFCFSAGVTEGFGSSGPCKSCASKVTKTNYQESRDSNRSLNTKNDDTFYALADWAAHHGYEDIKAGIALVCFSGTWISM